MNLEIDQLPVTNKPGFMPFKKPFVPTFVAVFPIRIRIHMFLGLPDPDMDPDPSIIKQK
jgi:hypothetical protein